MLVNDFVYGEEEIEEEVLCKLIASPSLQRLKSISQFGMPRAYYHRDIYSRYEHSLGVLLLLRKLGAAPDEQIAGLLHDVSHTAFSHVIDWVIGDPSKSDFQDNSHLTFLEHSELPDLLRAYGFDYRELAPLDRFSLLEQEAPALCADRVDYALREIKHFLPEKDMSLILSTLVNYQGKVTFKSLDAAELFAQGYTQCQRDHWVSLQTNSRYHLLALALKEALDKKLLSAGDFYQTDDIVLAKLYAAKDSSIIQKLDALKNGFKIELVSGADSIRLHKKFRYVDPSILLHAGTRRLSEISSRYAHEIEMQKQDSQVPMEVRFVY